MISADLGEHLEGFVADLVKSGRYNSKSEVLREGVRLVEEREARLKMAIMRGLEDKRAGRTRPADEVFDELERRFDELARSQS
ncbi:type II toxin-antitoxin system ParD family antitoxin [Leptolyngbya sp. 15MV]|nr:type II toxin-antitoxin system ParD family antitoxin [Leptolyngbya sp. 15MV]